MNATLFHRADDDDFVGVLNTTPHNLPERGYHPVISVKLGLESQPTLAYRLRGGGMQYRAYPEGTNSPNGGSWTWVDLGRALQCLAAAMNGMVMDEGCTACATEVEFIPNDINYPACVPLSLERRLQMA